MTFFAYFVGVMAVTTLVGLGVSYVYDATIDPKVQELLPEVRFIDKLAWVIYLFLRYTYEILVFVATNYLAFSHNFICALGGNITGTC